MFSRLSLLTVSMVTLVTALPMSASALTGDARNGADFSGEAIPIHVDHAIPGEAGEAALKKCTAGMLADVLEQLFPGADAEYGTRILPGATIQYGPCDRSAGADEGQVCAFVNIGVANSEGSLSVLSKDYLGGFDSRKRNYYLVNEFDVTGNLNLLPLPHLSFERVIKQKKYDRLGFLVSVDAVLKKPSIILGKFGTQRLDLFNSFTGAGPVGSLNVEKYVNCLSREIPQQ